MHSSTRDFRSSVGKAPVQIHARIAAKRARSGADPPNLTSVRRFLRGKKHRAEVPEARARKRIYNKRSVVAERLLALSVIFHSCLLDRGGLQEESSLRCVAFWRGVPRFHWLCMASAAASAMNPSTFLNAFAMGSECPCPDWYAS